jgi:hypothetical protein
MASLPSVIGRAALDGAGAKSILGDGWLGTALADPGSVLPKGWITNAANSVISTVGNVVADMVRGNGAQGGGGGGAINIFRSSMVMDKFVPKGVRSDPLGPDALQNSSHAKKLVKVYYNSGTYSWEEREAPPAARKSVSRSHGRAQQSGVSVNRATGESAASRAERLSRLQAQESLETARLHEEQLQATAMPAELQLPWDYGAEFSPSVTNLSDIAAAGSLTLTAPDLGIQGHVENWFYGNIVSIQSNRAYYQNERRAYIAAYGGSSSLVQQAREGFYNGMDRVAGAWYSVDENVNGLGFFATRHWIILPKGWMRLSAITPRPNTMPSVPIIGSMRWMRLMCACLKEQSVSISAPRHSHEAQR